ncbi:toll/interleukin-1 receptor domain-containing protein [Tahibacter caeni]|uniref:toll/interleukin-1 receptor domain-containing protein n=1 Tax=Tahibacter caeni TaxID=1453545 RepID=UPI0021491737
MAFKLFVSYAREDKSYREQLGKHLAALRRPGLVEVWHDGMIVAGQRFASAIDAQLNAADVILLLVSSDFLDSDYCYSIEMQRALEREQRGEACVIPVIVRPCAWKLTPFHGLQIAAGEWPALSQWPNVDEGYAQVVLAVRAAIDGLAARRLASPPHSTAPIPVAAVPMTASRVFSDAERLSFLRRSYADIRRAFDASLRRLSARMFACESELRQVDAHTFTCHVRRADAPPVECAVSLIPERRCIAYSHSAASRGHEFDEGVGVDADAQQLFLCVFGLDPASAGRSRFASGEAAELLWDLFARRLVS